MIPVRSTFIPETPNLEFIDLEEQQQYYTLREHKPRDWPWYNISLEKVRYQLNDYGYRCGRFDRELLDGRVWLFGGDATFGCGLQAAQSLAQRIWSWWGYECVNLGQPGAGRAEMDCLLEHFRGRGYVPRFTVLEVCETDDRHWSMKRKPRGSRYDIEWSTQQFQIIDRARDDRSPGPNAQRDIADWLGAELNRLKAS